MLYAFPFFAAFLLSLVLTPAAIWLAKKYGWLAKPRERDIHQKPKPRIGGAALVVTFTIVILLTNLLRPDLFAQFGFPYKFSIFSIDKRLLGILLAGGFIAAVMLYDDIKGLPAYIKLLAQITAALIAIFAGIGLVYLNNPFGNTIYLDSIKIPVQIGANVFNFVFWADILFLLWSVGMMNAVNFIDGLDGLAAGIVVLALMVIIFVSLKPDVNQPATALVATILAGAVLGFLPFNFYPAKIFLGDAGAMFLGLQLAILSVISGGKLAALFLVLGLVIIDGILVVASRIRRGKNPFTTPDQTHLHHRFLRAGISPRATVAAIWAISAIFGIIGLISIGKTKWYLAGLMVILILMLFGLLSQSIKLKVKRQNAKSQLKS